MKLGHRVVDEWPTRMWGFLPEWKRKEGGAQMGSRCDGYTQNSVRDVCK